MELQDKSGITHDFLSLHKETPVRSSQPPSSGHVSAAAIDLNVVAMTTKTDWSSCQLMRQNKPYSLGIDHCGSSGIFPPTSGQNCMDGSSRLKGFADDEEEDEEEFLKDPPRKGLSVKVDGSSNSGDDRKPTTPRSKHSATEQRRRSKINDRFQILRSLIPNTDQKRDKASFLLEVIDYIQHLQDKVHKYESPYPVWNPDNAKSAPWKSSQVSTDGGVIAAGAPLLPANMQQYPPATADGGFGFFHSQTRSMVGPADHGSSQWARSSSSLLADQREEDLVIDGGTISLSSTYSEGLLTTLTQALQSSGVDLSQASLSVRINLGRQAIGQDLERSSGDDSEIQRRPNKRRSANS